MIDLAKLSKQEYLKMAKWKCPLPGHSKHSGLSHVSCFQKLQKKYEGEKIAFIDIETEDLRADFGIIFSWCLIDAQNDKLYYDSLTLKDIQQYQSKQREIMPKEDTRILKSFLEKVSEYDRVVGHYSSRFDLQFLRTRAVICGVEFPKFGEMFQTDTWMILKNKFKLSRNTQQNATLKLLGQTRKDHLSLSIKHGCIRGEKWALDNCLKHCKGDVLDLRDLYNKICDYAKKTNTSI